MNLFAPSRYDERVTALALGVEPYLAVGGRRVRTPLRVLVEGAPRPLESWRRWRPGETVDDFLPRLPRHPSGRYSRRYDEITDLEVTLRLVSAVRRHGGVIPRRIRLTLDPLEPDPPPLQRRQAIVALFPGAGAGLPSGATVVRGWVVRAADPDVPLRWPRVLARNTAGIEVGWSHGDARGEFALVVGNAAGAVTLPAEFQELTLEAAAVDPPPTVPAEDLRLATLDPHWDLPIDDLAPSPDPHADPVANGRRFHPAQTVSAPVGVTVRSGRPTSVEVRV